MSGAQRRHEAPDLGAMMGRMLRALVRRAAEGDTEAIEELVRLERMASLAVADAGRMAHDVAGYSWTQIGDAMGTSRQNARQRCSTATAGV